MPRSASSLPCSGASGGRGSRSAACLRALFVPCRSRRGPRSTTVADGWPLANRDLSSTRADLIERHRSRQREDAARGVAVPLRRPRRRLGRVHRDAGRGARRRLRAGHGEQRVRARPEDRGGALGPPVLRRDGRPERRRRGRWTGVRRNGHLGVRALGDQREAPLDATPRDGRPSATSMSRPRSRTAPST